MEAPIPKQTKPIERNISALNSRMKLTSWYSSERSKHAKTSIQYSGCTPYSGHIDQMKAAHHFQLASICQIDWSYG